MKLPERIKAAYAVLTAQPQTDNQFYAGLMKLLSGRYNQNYNPKYTEYQDAIDNGYKINPHIYSVINYIARSISKIPFEVMEVTDEKEYRSFMAQKSSKNFERAISHQQKALKPAKNKYLIQTLEQPNESQNWEEFIYSSIGYKKLTGNDYIYGLAPAGFEGLFTKLYDMPSQLMAIQLGTFYEPVKGYILTFGGGQMTMIDAKDVLHRKEWNPDFDVYTGNVYGMSPLVALSNVIVRTNNAKEASVAMFRNGVPAGILSNDSGISMTDTDMEKLNAQLDAKFGGGSNKNRILQTSKKFNWQQLGLSSVDMQIIEAEKHDLIDVCRAYGLPSVLMENGEQSTYNNVLEAEKRAWTNCLIPEIENFASNMTKFWLKTWGEKDGKKYILDYDLRSVPSLQDDMKTLSERLINEMNMGLWTGNQVRQMMDKETGTEDHLNKFYIKQGLNQVDDNQSEMAKLLGSFSPLVANQLLALLTDKQIADLTGASPADVAAMRANAKPQPNINVNA